MHTMDNKMKIMLGIGVFLLLGLIAISFSEKQPVNITYETATSSIIPEGIEENAIIFNNITLFDSTQINEETNTCTATRHGMTIVIQPCVANDIDARHIKQNVSFTWNGGSSQRTDWIFVYEGELENGRMDAWLNTSQVRQEIIHALQWINNFQVTSVQSSVNLGTPDTRCQIGSINNTQMFNVTRSLNSTTFSQVYCFTNVSVINATTYSISGNRDIYPTVNVTFYEPHWVDVTDNIDYLGFGLLQDNRSYYRVSNVTFQPSQTITTLWDYTPQNKTDKGKWHILGFDGDVGLVNSIVNDQYIYVDPWWDNDVPYKRVLNITTQNAINTNYTHRVRIDYQAEFGANCANMYVAYNDTSTPYEIDVDYRICNATLVELGFRNQRSLPANTFDGNYSLYYGADAGTHLTDRNIVYVWNDDFGGSAINASKYGTVATGCSSVSGGICTLPSVGGGTGSNMLSNILFAQNFTFETNLSFEGTGGAPQQRFFGFMPVSTGIPDGGTPHLTIGGNEVTGLQRNGEQATSFSNSGYHPYTIFRNATSNGRGYQDNSSAFAPFSLSISFTDTTALPVGEQLSSSGGQKIDYWRVLGDVSARPVYVFGSQTANAGISVVANSPIDNYLTTFTTLNVTANVTSTGSTLISNATARIYNSSDALIQTIFNNTFSGSTQANITFPVSALSEGNYKWAVEARGDSNEDASTTNRTFTIDFSPPTLTLNANISDQFVEFFPVNVSLNYTASDPNLAQCFYFTSDNSTHSVFTCNTTAQVNFTSGGTKIISYAANDTLGTTIIQNTTFEIGTYSTAQSVDTIGEGGSSTFYLELNKTNIGSASISANLNYNSTAYAYSTLDIITANQVRIARDLVIPSGIGNATGKSAFWNWTFNVTGTGNFTTSTKNQTVYSVSINDCSAGGTIILNMTLKDEGTQAIVNATAGSNIEIDLIISSKQNSSITWAYSNTWTNDAEAIVCVPNGLLNQTNYTIDFVAEYGATDHVVEFYYLDNGTLSNSQMFNSLTNKTISLYDLASDDSTTFLFTFLDEDSIEVPNAIVHTFRQYIGDGEFREVERGKQDDNGQTHLHLVEEDVIYRFVISLEGEILFTSSTYNAKCLSSPCEINLESGSGFEEFPTDWQLLDGGSYAFAENATSRIVSLAFNLDTPSLMNLTVAKQDYTGDLSVVGTQSTTATGGTLQVTVPQAAGNVTYYAILYKDGEYIANQIVDFSPTASAYYSTTGTVMGSLLIVALILMGAAEGLLLFVFIILALILVGALALMKLGYYSLIGIICAIAIVVWKLIKRGRRYE